MPNYRNLMLADNNLDNPEFIFTINYDRIRTQTYGGTTFLINGAIGGDMVSSNYGTTDAWSGHRTTKAVSYTHLDVYKRQLIMRTRSPSLPSSQTIIMRECVTDQEVEAPVVAS